VLRHIATARGDIRLGVGLDSTWLSGVEPGATVVALPPGTVPGAQSVWVTRGPHGIVREITLNQEQATSFASLVARHRRILGSPVSHHRPADPEDAERIVWRDDATSFELIRDPCRSVSTIYGRLIDRRGPGKATVSPADAP
jgi:hypothetical protein